MAHHHHHHHPHRHGWRDKIHLGEDNARFLLLVFILAIYLTIGTMLFYVLEHQQDDEMRRYYADFYNNFTAKYKDRFNSTELDELIHASSLSYLPGQTRPKVDLYQSFYLAFTACATIGFGHVAPSTEAGRALMIVYGLFGCSAVILFYNLFLERIITLLALVLRTVHEFKQRRRNKSEISKQQQKRRGSVGSRTSSDSLENWKPSVYWVMICLFCLVCFIALSSSAFIFQMEGWDYFTALYFSFICFATIGFGDYVTGIQDNYGAADGLYRFCCFLIIIVGTSSLYSLFNVISIIIKHGLNFLIKKLDRACATCRCNHLTRSQASLAASRRNAIIPGSRSTSSQMAANGRSEYSESSGTAIDRRISDEMIDVREFLQPNKVSLAVMQKDLYESAQRGRTGFTGAAAPGYLHRSNRHDYHGFRPARSRSHSQDDEDIDFTPANIGPMAILEHTLGEDS